MSDQGGNPSVSVKISLENILIYTVSASFNDTSRPAAEFAFDYQRIFIKVGGDNSCFDAGSLSKLNI
ncbi:MAG: hypothetical protein GYA55_08690 [SAR324 cluster bacterium]|uniref:Uncharacterized protein n=1 Tax=SAR324 cluster bacterium TaxID=2024889 RepID=A0A7X9FS12_9DELT|nr:hypothetical protein [SAR324 cluster bacterium]